MYFIPNPKLTLDLNFMFDGFENSFIT